MPLPFGEVDYVLGLDLGANSVGWAAVRVDKDLLPLGLLHPPGVPDALPSMGVRVFEEGVEKYGPGDQEVSRAVARRQARLQRRQTLRRARRMKATFAVLQAAGFLPPYEPGQIDAAGGEMLARDRLIKDLDHTLARRWAGALDAGQQHLAYQRLPYLLRAKALDQRLEPYELGRALYHLAQRRGFASNRKSAPKKDEDAGKVKAGIHELEQAMATAGVRTLGEYFLGLDATGRRIRGRWTARAMYRAEFDAIWAAQTRFHPDLDREVTVREPVHQVQSRGGRRVREIREVREVTRPLGAALRRAIFGQRPLKAMAGRIGRCELETGRPRCPQAFLEAQHFRLLQKILDLRYYVDGSPLERRLSSEQVHALFQELDSREDMSFDQIRKLLDLGKKGAVQFNYQRGGEKKLPGNRTAARLRKLFGERWDALGEDRKREVVLDLWSIQKPEALERRVRRGRGAWGVLAATAEEAREVAHLSLEDGYSSLSGKAIRKLLPPMLEGRSYAEARQDVYAERGSVPVADCLPAMERALPSLRNPAVARALTELRKVVNAVVRACGKPAFVHLELARDLKRGRQERWEIQRRMRDNEKARERRREAMRQEAGLADPRPGDDLLWRLWEECRGVCPYTGKSISAAALFSGQVDIEHILPYSRSLDDSYLNKTLCWAEENRSVKQNRTPREAYGHDPERWAQIVQRMEKNVAEHGMPSEKLRRFQMDEQDLEAFLKDFTERQLNDTRYASREARRYLGLLYGGDPVRGVDAAGTLRVRVSPGGVTAAVRSEFGLNAVLGDGPGKDRTDHRHHAVDALAIALTTPATVKRLEDASARPAHERLFRGRLRRFGRVELPWDGFLDQVREAVDRIAVSHRVSARVRGALHKETFYSPPRNVDGRRLTPDELTDRKVQKAACSHVRKALAGLSDKDIVKIVDPVVREAVRARLQELGIKEPAKAFNTERPENYPCQVSGTGKRIPIRKVRIRKSNTTFPVGGRGRQRHVESDANHHMAVFQVTDRKGRPRWEAVVVPLHEAVARKRAQDRRRQDLCRQGLARPEAVRQAQTECPIVRREHPDKPEAEFLFALTRGDVLEMDAENGGGRRLYKIRGIQSDKKLQYVLAEDARLKKEQEQAGVFWRNPMSTLQVRNVRKVIVTPLGEVRRSHARHDAPDS